MPGVWWTRAAADNNGIYIYGYAAGVAYQPSTTPGGAPKIYERLYAQAGSDQIKMPTFTAGHAQVLPYPTLPATQDFGTGHGLQNMCTASRTPFWCCTGLGTGACTNSRIYVQTETGASPSSVGDSTFGPVEFPIMPNLFYNDVTNDAGTSTTLQYVTFTNNNNGRKFFFRWALSDILILKNADHLTFEDSDLGYTSRAYAGGAYVAKGVANGSNFPPINRGDSYLVLGWGINGSNVVRNIAFRRGAIHGTDGNEAVHFIGNGPKDRFTNILFENEEMGDAPYAMPNGLSGGTTLTPNAYTNQVQPSWPPPGYAAWGTHFPSHWGPLGGGGDTDGQFITTSNGQTIRNCYLHDGGLLSFFEEGSGDLLFENNRVDMGRMFYAGDGSLYPPMLVSHCQSIGGCGALGQQLSLAIPTRFPNASDKGAIIRNNVFENVYNNSLQTGTFIAPGGVGTLGKPATAGMIVNNTFHVKGDARSPGVGAIIQFWATAYPNWTMDGADGSKFLFKNNIMVRDTTSAGQFPLLQIDPVFAGQTDIDYNDWGGINGVWKVGNTTYTTYSAFQTGLRTFNSNAANETHSLNVDPLFVTPYSNLSIQLASPAYQTGLDLSALGFSTDVLGIARPAGQWSMGAYQGVASGTTSTTVTTTTSTSVSSTSSTTSTSTTVTTTTSTSVSSTSSTTSSTVPGATTSTSTSTTSTTSTVPPTTMPPLLRHGTLKSGAVGVLP
jgi:hypothetical protein